MEDWGKGLRNRKFSIKIKKIDDFFIRCGEVGLKIIKIKKNFSFLCLEEYSKMYS